MLEPMPRLPLFGYGTLLDPTLVGHLLERPVEAEPALLIDFEIVDLPDLPFPVAFESPGERAEGRLYRHLDDEDFVRLDAYGGVLEGLYQRVEAQVVAVPAGDEPASPEEKAFVYLPTDRGLRRRR